MKTKRTIILLTIIALAGGFAVRATRQVAQNRTALDALAARQSSLRDATAAAEQRLRTASEALTRLERKTGQPAGNPGAAEGANAAPGNGVVSKPAAAPRPLGPTVVIATDPQAVAEQVKSYRLNRNVKLGGMIKALGLSAEQGEKLKDLWLCEYEQKRDLNAAVEISGMDWRSAAYREAKAKITNTMQAKEAELLGDLEAPYREYYCTQAVRDLAQELAGTAVHTGETMTFAQVERTAQILTAASQRTQTGSRQGWVEPGTVNWEAARLQLQGVLSPTQIAALGNIVTVNTADEKAGRLEKLLTAEFKARLPKP